MLRCSRRKEAVITVSSFSNRLAGESSPYLLSHAGNPVHWFPWGPEALEKARTEDKPVFLSIGYSACHWCHVMARESFENHETAEILNRRFVCIKVDREERPDLDSVYMKAVQMITGSGGWPLNVFLFPDGTPFYGGTYFPPEEKAHRYGMTGFPTLLLRVAEAFRTRREDLVSAGQDLLSGFRTGSSSPGEIDSSLLEQAFRFLFGTYDRLNGGFGGAPKFPMPMVLEFLLRFHAGSGDEKALEMVETTLERMASGGIYDHLAGGFHRYSTDETWLVPHFEKMLYDNALLARVYTEAFQITGKSIYRRVAEQTLDYLVREMRHPLGGFYGAQDADSRVVPGGGAAEGAFYIWSHGEIIDILGAEGKMFCRMFDVTDKGNFQGRNILHTTASPGEVELTDRLRERLLIARNDRPKPFRDEKIVASWNGMAIRAFSAAAGAFCNRNYLDVAVSCAEFAAESLLRADGRMLRWWKDGIQGLPGFLEDYSLLCSGYLELYKVCGDKGWLERATSTAEGMVSLFWDKDTEVFHDTGTDHEQLFTRPRDSSDNSIPSGTSAAAEVLLMLSAAAGNEEYGHIAKTVIASHVSLLNQNPLGFGRMLCAAELFIAGVKRVVLEGENGKPDHYALLKSLLFNFHPHMLLIREEHGTKATAQLCFNGTCLPPVTDPKELASILEEPGRCRALQEMN